MNKVEKAKLEKDGLDVYDALMRAAREGWETLDDNDVMRMKWYGLYSHNTKDGHFMLRTKVVQGVLTADQAEVMASIAEDFGRGIIDCTTRQCFQIHWIRLENVPEIFRRLDDCGLTTKGACGDITRNVVGCTLAGIGHEQLVDGHATAQAIHDHFLGNRLYSNLPRKFKISVTGCAEDCARGLINDVALSGAVAEDGTRGFNLRVGGGLSSHPRFARWVDVFVTPQETPELRLTPRHNFLLPWIPADRVPALLDEPLARTLEPEPPLFTRGLQTCTGKEFCGLAKVYTKSRAAEIAKFLDAHVLPNGHGEDFRLHFAGCSSSCAQHQIADVGIEGVLKKVDGEFVEAMDIRIGGRLGPEPRFGDVVLKKVPHWDLNETLLRIFTLYET